MLDNQLDKLINKNTQTYKIWMKDYEIYKAEQLALGVTSPTLKDFFEAWVYPKVTNK